MFRLWTAILLGCAALVTLSCSTVQVHHDFDRDYNFSRLKTYEWLPASAPAELSELRIKRFRSVFDQQMASRGYTRTAENPDFLIAMHVTGREIIEVTDWGYRYGSYRWGRSVDVHQYTEGTALIDFVDSRSKELFWRGVVSAVAEPGLSPEAQEEKFSEASAKLLEKFPPF